MMQKLPHFRIEQLLIEIKRGVNHSGMKYERCEMWDGGCAISDTGCQIMETGVGIPDSK